MIRRAVGALLNAFPLNRVVTFLTPVFAIVAGWAATQAARYAPGLPGFGQEELTAIFVTGALAAGAAAYKWLDGWVKYEENQVMLELGSGGPPDPIDAPGVPLGRVSESEEFGTGTEVSGSQASATGGWTGGLVSPDRDFGAPER